MFILLVLDLLIFGKSYEKKVKIPFLSVVKVVLLFGCVARNSNLKSYLKVSNFQNEFMKSSFLPKDEPKIVPAQYRAEILTTFGSYFGRNDDLINPF